MGETGSCSVGGAMLSKSLIQFSVDGWGCVPSLLFACLLCMLSRISPSDEYSGLISFRIDWFDALAVQGTLKSLLQHHSSKASVLQCSAFFIAQHSYPYMTTGKNPNLTPQETDPDLPVSVQESLAEVWVGGGLLWGRGH